MTTARRDTRIPMRRRWTAVIVGVLVGSAGRNLPVALAHVVVADRAGSCGPRSTVECAFDALPDAFAVLFKFALFVLLVTALLAAAGIVLVGLSVARRRTAETDARPQPQRSGPQFRDLALLAGGVALVMPALWLAVSFLWFVVG